MALSDCIKDKDKEMYLMVTVETQTVESLSEASPY